jgi:predicted HAD superfamily Cof-like phosphohydrolase
LIAEELEELGEAVGVNVRVDIADSDARYDGQADIVAAADALADLEYVSKGSAVTWGIPLSEVFDEVHRSNMTKVGGGRRADGKILKPATYSPPQIGRVLVDVANRPHVVITYDQHSADCGATGFAEPASTCSTDCKAVR